MPVCLQHHNIYEYARLKRQAAFVPVTDAVQTLLDIKEPQAGKRSGHWVGAKVGGDVQYRG